MYIDTLLFIVAGASALLALATFIYIIMTKKRVLSYQNIIENDTTNIMSNTTKIKSIYSSTTVDNNGTQNSIDKDMKGENYQTSSLERSVDIDITQTIRLRNDDITKLLSEIKTNAIDEKEMSNESIDFEFAALEEKYFIESELHGGGMSRVFIVRNRKLGNRWIAKFVPNGNGELMNEGDILKRLNHISLPSIVDVFESEEGICLVESFIEGETLDKVLKTNTKLLSQELILNWASQIVEVISYLHNSFEHAIYHLDLKPSNIMVTHNNRLVIIDFGISKQSNKTHKNALAVTFRYAAPEQLKLTIPNKYRDFIQMRFGELPHERLHWNLDARTDIYAIGLILFELITNELPNRTNLDLVDGYVIEDLANTVRKCIEVSPENRFQTAEDLINALTAVGSQKYKMLKSVFRRKAAIALCIFSVLSFGSSISSASIIYNRETNAIIVTETDLMIVSIQSEQAFDVNKIYSNGRSEILKSSEIKWHWNNDNIAYVNGNRVIGMNVGDTVLKGEYRNKSIEIKVSVRKPILDEVQVSQMFTKDSLVSLFVGTTNRDLIDGNMNDAETISPQSIAMTNNGDIYFIDSGYLRKLSEYTIETILPEEKFLNFQMVRSNNNELILLTDSWEDESGFYYGLYRYNGVSFEELYVADAKYTRIDDYQLSEEGKLYFIEYNAGADLTFLKSLNIGDLNEVIAIQELSFGTCSLTFEESNKVFLSNAIDGTIHVYQNGKLEYFAGVLGEKAFNDGKDPRFYSPQRIKIFENQLYIWDFNVVRVLDISNEHFTYTLAGNASPNYEVDIKIKEESGWDTTFAYSEMTDFLINNKELLLTDPKRGVIWKLMD